jgi:crotonobetainyl-CoA:carnitine CoA-transferase CaiB-like acyl-CoA transferase
MRHPLDGILVVALEQAVAAPFATRQLADLGARVIKVDSCFATNNARVEHNDELTAPPIAAKPTDVQG